MPFTLFDAVVPPWLQVLGATAGLLDKAQAYCAEHHVAPEEIVEARLASDMLPFGYQVKSTVAHSVGAVEGMRRGVFSPDMTPWPQTMAGLKAAVADARTTLAALEPAEVNGWEGRDMRFEMGATVLPFTAEGFLTSFSLPNFYFHAVTAYDLLRVRGVALGKRDFLGAPRLKM